MKSVNIEIKNDYELGKNTIHSERSFLGHIMVDILEKEDSCIVTELFERLNIYISNKT